MRKRFCKHCGDLYSGTCQRCHPGWVNDRGVPRPSRHQRGYDSDWERVRKMVLAKTPMCVDCANEGRLGIPAIEVHHVIPISGNPKQDPNRLDPMNLVPLCEACHDARHNGVSQRTIRNRADGYNKKQSGTETTSA